MRNVSYSNLIEANIILNCVNGISFTGTVAQSGNQVIGNQVTGGVVGLHMEWPIKAVISGNRFEGSQSAINLSGTYNGEGQIVITGNVCLCTGEGAAAVALKNGSKYGMIQNLIFSNNTIVMTTGTNSSDAIQCLGVNGCVFANNIVLSATQSASCIAFRGTDTGNLVTGNYLQGGFNGVLVNDGGAVNNTIAGNTFQSQSSGAVGVYLSSAPTIPVGTVIQGNRFLSTVITPISGSGSGTVIIDNTGTGMTTYSGPIGVNGAAPPAKAADPGTATSTDAAVINAIVTILKNLGFCS